MKFYIQGIGVCAPMFADWQRAMDVLLTETPIDELESVKLPKAALLAPTERRRASRTVNLALSVAQQVQQHANIDMGALCKVFACSHGDSDIFDYLCSELSQSEVILSPTKFHQSLHNSVAGYWDICSGSSQSSTSISAGEYTFIAGLIESALLAINQQQPVLFVSYDLNPPARLNTWIKISKWMAVAFVLTPEPTKSTIAACHLSIGRATNENTVMSDPNLELFRQMNPAAASLPLLKSLTHQENENIYFDFHQGQQVTLAVSMK